MLGFMAVSGLLGWFNIRGLAVSVRLPDEVYAGVPTLVSIRIENGKRYLPSFLITARVADSPTSYIILDPGTPETGSIQLAFPERGMHGVPLAVISSPFPVNFFVRYIRVPVPGLFPVFPAPRPSATPVAGGKPDAGTAQSHPAPGYDGELAKISDYRGGESLKRIHWRLSAKHEDFKVKHMTANAVDPVVLELERIPGRDLEERLAHCAFLVNRLQRAGRPVGLKLAGRVIAPASTRPHRLKLLGELAVYGQD